MATDGRRWYIDSAALAGAATAAVVAIFFQPGPYDYTSAIVGLILIAVLCAYEAEKKRDRRHSVAFAAVFALCLLMPVGLLLEIGYEGLDFNPDGEMFCRYDVPPGREPICDVDSAVPSGTVDTLWVILVAVMYALDRRVLQSPAFRLRMGASEDSEQAGGG